MTTNTKDSVLVASLVLSVVSLVLLFGVTWYFQSSLSLLQQQVEYDRELLVKLQEQVKVKGTLILYNNTLLSILCVCFWVCICCVFVCVGVCACMCMSVFVCVCRWYITCCIITHT